MKDNNTATHNSSLASKPLVTGTCFKGAAVLVGCERTQAVTIELRKRGIEAFSNDIQDCTGGHPEWHLKMDMYEAMKLHKWDMGLFFTPCTYSCNSGIRWLYNADKSLNEKRYNGLLYYAGMLKNALQSDIPLVACENPIPHRFAIEIIGRKYDQIIQPWQFGHGEQKATCLWLKGLPLLKPTNIVEGREQKIWKMAPSENRGDERSKTYTGIADAMAKQWGLGVLAAAPFKTCQERFAAKRGG